MVVSGGRMKERNRFLAAEGFNVQLKKRRPSREFLPVGGRRVKFARSSGETGLSLADSFSTVNGKVVEVSVSKLTSFTVQPTTYQKVRRIIEEHSERQARSTSRSKVGPSSSSSSSTRNKSRDLNNYTIVATPRRENIKNSRNQGLNSTGFSSFSVCETIPSRNYPASNNYGANNYRRKSSREGVVDTSTKNSKLPSVTEATKKQRQVGVKVTFVEAKENRKLNWESGSLEDCRDHGYQFGNQKKFIGKPSASSGRDSTASRRISLEGKTAQVSRENGIFTTATGLPESYRTELRRSPSTTLPSSWKKPARVGVKKSVSFSSDTSFQEKKSLFCNSKTHVHEAKVYHKGVLQDRSSSSFESLRNAAATSPSASTPTTTTTPNNVTPGGPSALVRAAREGNNTNLRQIMARAKTPQGSKDMNINAVDASGRTALSYMAGNGAAAMLEAALSFPEIDVNLPDNEGNTPLHFAAQAGQLECVSILLQRCSGIEIDARNTLGFTPLMKAALQGRTKCAKILLFAGANPTLRDYGRGLRAEQWARFCGRYVCAEVIERFARHRLLERTTSCRWGSEPELAARIFQGKVTPMPTNIPAQSTGLRSKIRRVFRTSSGPDNRSFSLVSQLTSAALCASSPALPRPGEVPPVVKSLLRPLSVPQLRITLVAGPEGVQPPPLGTGYRSGDKYQTNFTEKIVSEKIESNSMTKPPRSKKKNK